MRQRLAKFQRKRKTFQGRFEQFIVKADNPKRPYIVFLVRQLCFPHGVWLSDHVWVITNWPELPEQLATLQGGETVEFDAEIVSYLKRYLTSERDGTGRRVKKIRWIKNYGLRNPTFATVKEGQQPPAAPLTHHEVRELQEALDFLVTMLS